MGILSKLKRLTGFDNNTPDSPTSKECSFKVKIKKSEFIVMCKYYYRGHTSYKDYYKFVFLRNTKKIIETMNKAKEKASSGCNIESTFVVFYYDDKHFLEIPFEVFSDKRNIPISIRNTKHWNKSNLIRILKLYPEFKKYENVLISESDIIELLFGE